uniref:Ground-like domain-containing protein n=1 Tax=Steinernema glaseri TaxID=37863 RepID=A0A1I7ZSR1_9BILA
MLRIRSFFFLVLLLISSELVSGSPGFFGCGCGRRKREISAGDELILESPLWTDGKLECPQNRWKTTIQKAMAGSADAIHAKFAIHKAMESEFGERFFVVCADTKSSFVTSGHAFCAQQDGSRNLFCYVTALLG